jgi:hypothetical protein
MTMRLMSSLHQRLVSTMLPFVASAALSLGGVLMIPADARANCMWTTCSGPSYYSCPNYCGTHQTFDIYWDIWCYVGE